MFRVLAIMGVIALASCTGSNQAAPDPAPSTAAAVDPNSREPETPNSFPQGMTPINAMGPETDVVGVTHLPP